MRRRTLQTSVLLFAFLYTLITGLKAQQTQQKEFKGPVVFIQLMLPSADSMLLIDGTAAMYSKKFSDSVDEYDAGKLYNFNENICLVRNGEKLAIEARKCPIIFNDTLFVNMWGLKKQTYSLDITFHNLAELSALGATLYDKYANKNININLNDSSLYNFTVDTNAASYKNRFMLVFRKKGFTAQPVKVEGQYQIAGKVTIYPNPVSTNHFKLQFQNMLKDNYSVVLTDFSGRVLVDKNIVHAGGSNEYYISLNSVTTPGIYSITILGRNIGKTIHLPLIIN